MTLTLLLLAGAASPLQAQVTTPAAPFAAPTSPTLPLIPLPVSVERHEGSFTVAEGTAIAAAQPLPLIHI